MSKIRTAEEVLLSEMLKVHPEALTGLNSLKKEEPELFECIVKSHAEYAKQFIDLAAEEARTRINDESTSIIVDKESILKLKERVV